MATEKDLRVFERDFIRLFRLYNQYLERLKHKLNELYAFLTTYDERRIAAVDEHLEASRADLALQRALVEEMAELARNDGLAALLQERYGLSDAQRQRVWSLLDDFHGLLDELQRSIGAQQAFFRMHQDAMLLYADREKLLPFLHLEFQASQLPRPKPLPAAKVEELIAAEIACLQRMVGLGEVDSMSLGLTADTTLYARMQQVVHDIAELMRMQNAALERPIGQCYDVIIIGGGSSGLACMSELTDRKYAVAGALRVLCIDKQGDWGGNWRHYPPQMYMNSSIGQLAGDREDTISIPRYPVKQSAVGHGRHAGDYLSMAEMALYQKEVAERLQLRAPLADIVVRVRRIVPGEAPEEAMRFAVECRTGRRLFARNVIVSTGIFDSPQEPALENFYRQEYVEIPQFNDLRNDFDLCTANEFFLHYQSETRPYAQNTIESYVRHKKAIALFGSKLTAIKLLADIVQAAQRVNPQLVIFAVTRGKPMYQVEAGTNPESAAIRDYVRNISAGGSTPAVWFEPFTARASHRSRTATRSIFTFIRSRLQGDAGLDHSLVLEKSAEGGSFLDASVNKCASAGVCREEKEGTVVLHVDGVIYAIGYSASTHVVDQELLPTARGYIVDPAVVVADRRESARSPGLFVTGIIMDMPIRRKLGIVSGSHTQAAIFDSIAIAKAIADDHVALVQRPAAIPSRE